MPTVSARNLSKVLSYLAKHRLPVVDWSGCDINDMILPLNAEPSTKDTAWGVVESPLEGEGDTESGTEVRQRYV